jgi:hypothetical protein
MEKVSNNMSDKPWLGTNQKQYALYGALFGLCFPIMGTLLECYLQAGDFSMGKLLDCQKNSPMLWIIDTAPLFLGWFASFGGKQFDYVQIKNY